MLRHKKYQITTAAFQRQKQTILVDVTLMVRVALKGYVAAIAAVSWGDRLEEFQNDLSESFTHPNMEI